MQTGSNLEKAKIYNERLVLDLIRAHGKLSRSELARRTALTPPTVSNIVNSLLEQNLVLPAGRAQGQRGSPSTLFSLNPAGALSVGINLERDHVAGVLLDLSGKPVAECERELDLTDEPQVRGTVRELLLELASAREFDAHRLWGVGIGVPNSVGEFDKLASVLPGEVEAAIPAPGAVPVFIENNATAAGLGEYWYGEGGTFPSFFYLLFGVGLGGGIVSNGAAVRGAHGFAGEIGRTPICEPAEEPGSEGRVLEDVASLRALYRSLDIDPSKLGRRERLATAADLAERGDVRFQAWLESASEHLASALIQVECLLDPHALVLGGSLPEPVMHPLAERLDERLGRLRQRAGKSQAAQLVTGRAGDRAGSLGVGILPLYETIAPKHDLLQKTPLDAIAAPGLLMNRNPTQGWEREG